MHTPTNWAIIDSHNGLSPAECQAITLTNAGLLFIVSTYVEEFKSKYNDFHTWK